MDILLYNPYSVSETKTGTKNADSIFPVQNSGNKQDRLYIVCGGNPNQSLLAGEMVCDAIKTYFHSFLDDRKDITPQFIEKAIRMGEIALPEGASVTLSICYFAPDAVYLSQIGGSYICQIRDNQIIYKSVDTSTDKRLRGVKQPVEINLVCLKDIQANDQFFICNYRIDSAMEEEEICRILSESATSGNKLDQIKHTFLNKYKRSLSAHLIPVKEVKKRSTFRQKLNLLFYSFV